MTIAGAGPGPDGENETWSAQAAADAHLGEHGVGQGGRTVTPQSRMEFVGAESLAALTAEHKATQPTCAECDRKEKANKSLREELAALRTNLQFHIDRKAAQDAVDAVEPNVNATIRGLQHTIRELQARDRTQRHDLDIQYFRADAAEAKLHLHSLQVPELPARFRNVNPTPDV